jgi:hypothetical protein
VVAGSRNGRRAGHSGRRDALPELGDNPILERLDVAPLPAPSAAESSHDKARRALIAEPGQWVVLNARVKLSEATARRLARSYQRAKPTRLVASANGRFTARPFIRNDTWLVAAAYLTSDSDPSPG